MEVDRERRTTEGLGMMVLLKLATLVALLWLGLLIIHHIETGQWTVAVLLSGVWMALAGFLLHHQFRKV